MVGYRKYGCICVDALTHATKAVVESCKLLQVYGVVVVVMIVIINVVIIITVGVNVVYIGFVPCFEYCIFFIRYPD